MVTGTGGLFFHSVGNFIIPTAELIFFRRIGIPPTRLLMMVLSGNKIAIRVGAERSTPRNGAKLLEFNR